jgi:hypothetical protein
MATNANPYTAKPGEWGRLTIGGVLVPGVITSIDDCDKPVEWTINRPVMGANAVTIWKGDNLAEDIKIKVNLHNASAFDAWYLIRDVLHPKLGKRPPTLQVVNPSINFARVTMVCCRCVGVPKAVTGNSWEGLIRLVEFGPRVPIKPGPPDPLHVETENDRREKEFSGLLTKVRDE